MNRSLFTMISLIALLALLGLGSGPACLNADQDPTEEGTTAGEAGSADSDLDIDLDPPPPLPNLPVDHETEALDAFAHSTAAIFAARDFLDDGYNKAGEPEAVEIDASCGFVGCSSSFLIIQRFETLGVNPQLRSLLARIDLVAGANPEVTMVELKEKFTPQDFTDPRMAEMSSASRCAPFRASGSRCDFAEPEHEQAIFAAENNRLFDQEVSAFEAQGFQATADVRGLLIFSSCGFAGCSAEYLVIEPLRTIGVNPQLRTVLATVEISEYNIPQVTVVEVAEPMIDFPDYCIMGPGKKMLCDMPDFPEEFRDPVNTFIKF